MKKINILGLSLALVISACNTGRTDEENIQKLLDRQSELKELQEESVDRLQVLKDSLDMEKRSLIEQRDSRDRQIGQMEDNQQMLVERLFPYQNHASSGNWTAVYRYRYHHQQSVYVFAWISSYDKGSTCFECFRVNG